MMKDILFILIKKWALDFNSTSTCLRDYLLRLDVDVYEAYKKVKNSFESVEIGFWLNNIEDIFLMGEICPVFLNNEYKCSIISLVNITNYKKSESLMRDMISEKDLSRSEIHHRVKNNLQVINSLLSL